MRENSLSTLERWWRAAPCAAAILALTGVPARSDEVPFSYVYGADSLLKGHWEYEQWNTLRAGKAAGSYTAFDLQNEFEHGFTDNFQAALYINSSYLHTRDVPNPDDPTTLLENQSAFDVNGVSMEFKYRLLNPDQHPMGISLN
jgi:hypothetical protein